VYGTFTGGPTPFWPDPISESGGAGMYSNVHNYTRVLSDLLEDEPVLLRRETVNQIFSPKFSEDSPALTGLKANGVFVYKCVLDDSMEGVDQNQALRGLLLMEDVQREEYFKSKDTMSWTGLPNLLWSINRERGLALMMGVPGLLWADRNCFNLIAGFETAVSPNLKV
jgi:hypothetical protein